MMLCARGGRPTHPYESAAMAVDAAQRGWAKMVTSRRLASIGGGDR
jgi:hypothetical protein